MYVCMYEVCIYIMYEIGSVGTPTELGARYTANKLVVLKPQTYHTHWKKVNTLRVSTRNTFFDVVEEGPETREGPATCPPSSDGIWASISGC